MHHMIQYKITWETYECIWQYVVVMTVTLITGFGSWTGFTDHTVILTCGTNDEIIIKQTITLGDIVCKLDYTHTAKNISTFFFFHQIIIRRRGSASSVSCIVRCMLLKFGEWIICHLLLLHRVKLSILDQSKTRPPCAATHMV